MPVYEYRCAKCDREFEVLVRSGRERIACPKCRSKKVKKRYSVFGLNFGSSAGAGGG